MDIFNSPQSNPYYDGKGRLNFKCLTKAIKLSLNIAYSYGEYVVSKLASGMITKALLSCCD